MGFTQNSLSYTVYEVVGGAAKDSRDAILDGLQLGRISMIDIDVGHDRATGFAVFDDPLDTNFTAEKVFFDPLVLFGFRVDKLTVPSTTLRLYVRKRVNENLAATRREKMPKNERDAIKETVHSELLRRAIPAISAVDVVWDTVTNRVRIFTTSTAMNDEFVSRCRDRLNLELRPLDLVGVVDARMDETEAHEVWHLLPTSFLPVGGGVRERDEGGENA
jgi:hypothetical protein